MCILPAQIHHRNSAELSLAKQRWHCQRLNGGEMAVAKQRRKVAGRTAPKRGWQNGADTAPAKRHKFGITSADSASGGHDI